MRNHQFIFPNKIGIAMCYIYLYLKVVTFYIVANNVFVHKQNQVLGSLRLKAIDDKIISIFSPSYVISQASSNNLLTLFTANLAYPKLPLRFWHYLPQ